MALKEQVTEDEQFVKLFRREAKITANLDHLNTVAVNNAGVTDEQIDRFFVENPKNLFVGVRTESEAAPAEASIER